MAFPRPRYSYIKDNIGYIQLANGTYTKVDLEDFEELKQYNWFATGGGKPYPARHAQASLGEVSGYGSRKVRMTHHLITVPIHMVVDHLNGDTLDCRKDNLEVVSSNVRQLRKLKKQGHKSIQTYKGVRKHPWGSYIMTFEATFRTEEEAARAYDEHLKLYEHEPSELNFPLN